MAKGDLECDCGREKHTSLGCGVPIPESVRRGGQVEVETPAAAYARGHADGVREREELDDLASIVENMMHYPEWWRLTTFRRKELTTALARIRAQQPPEPAGEATALPWLVVIVREGAPEVTPFESYSDALAFFGMWSAQWSESYLAHAVRAPRDGWMVMGEATRLIADIRAEIERAKGSR